MAEETLNRKLRFCCGGTKGYLEENQLKTPGYKTNISVEICHSETRMPER